MIIYNNLGMDGYSGYSGMGESGYSGYSGRSGTILTATDPGEATEDDIVDKFNSLIDGLISVNIIGPNS